MKASCPKCGHHGFVAKFVATQSIPIEGVDGNGLLTYGEAKTTGGTLDSVRCPACGETVPDDYGNPIRSLSVLADWLCHRAVKDAVGGVAE